MGSPIKKITETATKSSRERRQAVHPQSWMAARAIKWDNDWDLRAFLPPSVAVSEFKAKAEITLAQMVICFSHVIA